MEQQLGCYTIHIKYVKNLVLTNPTTWREAVRILTNPENAKIKTESVFVHHPAYHKAKTSDGNTSSDNLRNTQRKPSFQAITFGSVPKHHVTSKQNFTLNYKLPHQQTFGAGHLPELTVKIYNSKTAAIIDIGINEYTLPRTSNSGPYD